MHPRSKFSHWPHRHCHCARHGIAAPRAEPPGAIFQIALACRGGLRSDHEPPGGPHGGPRRRDHIRHPRGLAAGHVGEGAVPGREHIPGVREDDSQVRRGRGEDAHAAAGHRAGVPRCRLPEEPGARRRAGAAQGGQRAASHSVRKGEGGEEAGRAEGVRLVLQRYILSGV